MTFSSPQYRRCVMAIFFALMGISSAEGSSGSASVGGLITAVTGTPVLGPGGAGKTPALGDRVSMATELHTRQDEMVEILWDRRALILVQPQSIVSIKEPSAGQTQVDLRSGGVRVALAYGGNPSDLVAVHTPSSRVVTRGGIMEINVAPPPSLFAQVASMFSSPQPATSRQPVETVHVLEGQSGVEPLHAKGGSDMLEAGELAQVALGSVAQRTQLPQGAGTGVGLAAIDRRHGTPQPLTQRLVKIHVAHALEVERLMNAAPSAVDQPSATTGADVKGTIVATSLGVPNVSFTQPGTVAPTGGNPTVTAPPSVTSPLPTLPPIQTPTVTTLTPSQSGGFNSRNLLKDILGDDDRKGRRKGRDKD